MSPPPVPRAAASLALALAAHGPARAHAFLARASPAVGATVAQAPDSVRLDFTEAIEPAFSRLAVEDAAGASVDTGAVAVGADGTALSVGLRALPPGTYLVRWRVTAIDTHHTEGTFRFTVAPPRERQ